jgi:hypothetical protein
VKYNVTPFPGSDVIQIRPPYRSTILLPTASLAPAPRIPPTRAYTLKMAQIQIKRFHITALILHSQHSLELFPSHINIDEGQSSSVKQPVT